MNVHATSQSVTFATLFYKHLHYNTVYSQSDSEDSPSNSSAFPPIACQNCIVTFSAYFFLSSDDRSPAASENSDSSKQNCTLLFNIAHTLGFLARLAAESRLYVLLLFLIYLFIFNDSHQTTIISKSIRPISAGLLELWLYTISPKLDFQSLNGSCHGNYFLLSLDTGG